MGENATSIVIFGASGDLTHRKLIPALYNLYRKERLPNNYNIVGVARSDFNHEVFRQKMREGVREFSADTLDDALWTQFANHLWYVAGDATKTEGLEAVLAFLRERENGPSNRLYYLAVAPTLYEPILHNLGEL